MHSAVAGNKLYFKVLYLFDKMFKSVIIFINLWVIRKMWTGKEKRQKHKTISGQRDINSVQLAFF